MGGGDAHTTTQVRFAQAFHVVLDGSDCCSSSFNCFGLNSSAAAAPRLHRLIHEIHVPVDSLFLS